MPKLLPLTPKTLIRILLEHGFVLERSRGSHHLYYNAETMRRVVVPIHKKALPKGTLMAILHQAGLNKDDVT
ncbi:MAG: hypothetical protein A2284_15715 [Deltaproteobacteria bacterium RIFOXYA12_FULL_61_11]|nr:MAG: hypothetical protein A2284_15715 [Deltaproteobacteria bacterium RIFOXYA12_FULL_61_11]